jgi:hypothetical protein
MMAGSSAKSLEYELITTVFNHFAEFSDLYNRACQLLKSFIDSTDPNRRRYIFVFKILVKGMGLESLKKLLHNDPKLLNEYYEFLIECYVKGDRLNKMTISEIFAEFLDNKSVEEVVNTMVTDIKGLAKASSNVLDLVDKIIQNILKICSKNYYANISDPDWLLLDVLLPVLPILKNAQTAQLAIDIVIVFLANLSDNVRILL